MSEPNAPLLAVEGLRKSFFGVEVLKGVSFSLEAGQTLGLIGENGSGKSTTMNIINGLLAPTAGTMSLEGRPYAPATAREAASAGLSFIHQELNLFENLTVAENLAIQAFPKRWGWLPQIDGGQMRRRAVELLKEVDLSIAPDMPLNRLAQGERQLVEIAKALAGKPRIIVFDEPTTSLTSREAARLFDLVGRLKRRGLGIIYISHILEDVGRLCDDVAILRDGALVMKRPIAELAISDMTSAMLGRPLSDLFPPPAEPVAQSAPILEVRNLSQPGIIADVNLAVMPGEVVGIAGLMGSGRSETARVIFGLDPAVTGEVSVAGQRIEPRTPRNCLAAGVAFLTEDRRGDGLMMAEGILTNLQLARLADENRSAFTALPERALDSDSVAMAETVRIKAHDLRKQPTRSLSGGNQQKVVLGKWLLRDPKVFILDEPTRGIDVGAKAEIYGLIRGLAQRGAGVLIISSELEELFGTCHRILVMAHGEIVSEVHGPSFDRAAILEAAMQPQSGSA